MRASDWESGRGGEARERAGQGGAGRGERCQTVLPGYNYAASVLRTMAKARLQPWSHSVPLSAVVDALQWLTRESYEFVVAITHGRAAEQCATHKAKKKGGKTLKVLLNCNMPCAYFGGL